MLQDQVVQASRAKKIECDPFYYTAVWLPLGAGATTPVNINVQTDSDFVLRYLTFAAYTVAGTFLVDPDFLITFFDAGAGRQLSDAPVHIHGVSGDGFWPYVLPEPKLLKGGTILTVTLINNTAVAAARCDLALHGYKVFYYQGFNRVNANLSLT